MIITLLKTFLLPPALQLLMLLVAACLWWRSRVIAGLLAILAWISLLLFSLPIVSSGLFYWLEAPYFAQYQSSRQPILADAQAIVVLGGGRQRHPPEYADDQLGYHALWRIRYGVKLAKALELPLIVSGGTVYPYETLSEAQIATRLLAEDYGFTEVIQEGASRNTWQNAENTAALAAQQNINKVILVTHAYHMRRSQLAFDRAGLDTIPMPTGFYSTDVDGWWDSWLPQAQALYNSQLAIHEYLGLLAYALRQ